MEQIVTDFYNIFQVTVIMQKRKLSMFLPVTTVPTPYTI